MTVLEMPLQAAGTSAALPTVRYRRQNRRHHQYVAGVDPKEQK